MLAHEMIAEIAGPILADAIAPAEIERLDIEDYAGSDGEAALRILAIANRVDPSTVRMRAKASAEVQRALEQRGESRFAFVSYAEPAWLKPEAEDDAA